jgi:DNA-binding winged helix-turn-helix (wHTH) protein
MQTNRKHAAERPKATSGHALLRNPDDDAAPWSWEEPSSSEVATERSSSGAATEATPAMTAVLGDDFNPGSMLPLAPVKVRCGVLEMDRAERGATLDGRALSLTRREHAVLLCLADRANRVVQRSVLLETIWTSTDDQGLVVLDVYPWSNVVSVYVNHLRKKLGPHARMIETVRGYGYCLRPARDSSDGRGRNTEVHH